MHSSFVACTTNEAYGGAWLFIAIVNCMTELPATGALGDEQFGNAKFWVNNAAEEARGGALDVSKAGAIRINEHKGDQSVV